MSRSDTLDPEFSPGTYVVDTDSGDPDLALVLSTPGATCIEWDVDRDSPDGRTVADDNPDYSGGSGRATGGGCVTERTRFTPAVNGGILSLIKDSYAGARCEGSPTVCQW